MEEVQTNSPEQTNPNPNSPDLASQGETLQATKQPTKPKRKINFLKLIIFGFVIIITILAFSLIAYLVKNQNQTQVNQTVKTAVKSPSPTITPATKPTPTYIDSSDIKGWKAITGLGYTISYPPEYQVEDANETYFSIFSPEINQFDSINKEGLKIEVRIEKVNKTFEEWSDWGEEPVITDFMTINGKQAKIVLGDSKVGIGNKIRNVYYLDGNKGAVFISWPYNSDRLKEFYQILSTFKFTDTISNELDENGWITYKNNEIGFQFKYPNKYQSIKINKQSGELNAEDNDFGVWINFDPLCFSGCTKQDTPFSVNMDSDGLIEMFTASKDWTGYPGTSRPLPTISDYTVNNDDTVTLKDYNGKYKYIPFEGGNASGVIIKQFDKFHNLEETRVIFKLNNKNYSAFNFMSHDSPGKSTNSELLQSIAKTFELINQ